MTKICTDIKQSKKLIELGIDVSTSDCSWILHPVDGHYILSLTEPLEDDIPAWSLAALLDLIPNYQLQTQDNGIGILFGHKKGFEEATAECPLDACVAMILKLHEQKLL